MTKPEKEQGRELVMALLAAKDRRQVRADAAAEVNKALRFADDIVSEAENQLRAWCQRVGVQSVSVGDRTVIVRGEQPPLIVETTPLDPPPPPEPAPVPEPTPQPVAPAVSKKKAVKGE